MADDITKLLPLAVETPDSILARMQIDLNAGIDPGDPLYADIVPGSVWDDMARADGLEMDRIYDRLGTQVPAAALPTTATGGWLDMWAAALNLQRKDATVAGGVVTFTGASGTLINAGVQVSTEAPAPGVDPITFQTVTAGAIDGGGTYDATVEALDPGSIGNVAANAVTVLDTPINGVSVSNAAAITGGSDVETDEALQARVAKKLAGTNGAGNIDYYENLVLNTPGVGYVTVLPNTPTVGHVTIIVSDINHQPAPTALIDSIQETLDPAPVGQGFGLAAPGATVHVTTPSVTAVALAATVALAAGYSLDGSAGTQNVTPDITTAVQRYFLSLAAGATVVHNKVLAAIIDVDGVVNVTALTLNGGTGDVTVASTSIAEITLPLTLS